MMEVKDVLKVWTNMELSCTISISPSYAEKFCKKVGVKFDSKLVYHNLRYREMAKELPRVDCEDLLKFVFDKLRLKPNEKKLEDSYRFNGEGSRRSAVERAYFDLEVFP